MTTGILAGITWALETVLLGIALGMSPFLSTAQAAMLAPFAATCLHDGFSALYMLVYNVVRGEGKELLRLLRTKSVLWLVLSSAIGGPIGMTGYVLAVKYMGASVGAVASAVYPAIGTVLAFFFLKEQMRWYRWLFLAATLCGVYGLSYSPALSVENFWLGLLGAFMCAFGWGIEAVILAKCLKDPVVKNEHALWVRQTTSFILYAALILPALGGLGFTARLFAADTGTLLPVIAAAALCATVSYLLYYRTIGRLGASKAMALNITYTAWAIVFTVVLLRDTSVLNTRTLLCAAVVVICGVLAATDMTELFTRRPRK